MGKRSKSKRFSQQGSDAVRQHAEKFPYHSTFEEEERRQEAINRTQGGH